MLYLFIRLRAYESLGAPGRLGVAGRCYSRKGGSLVRNVPHDTKPIAVCGVWARRRCSQDWDNRLLGQ